MKLFYISLLSTTIISAHLLQETFQDFSTYESPEETLRAVQNVQFQNIVVQNTATIEQNLIVDRIITVSSIISSTPNNNPLQTQLYGDVIGSFTTSTVAFVGGQTAASVAAATDLMNSSTSFNTANSVVYRNEFGAFKVQDINATKISTINFSADRILTTSASVSATTSAAEANTTTMSIASAMKIGGGISYRSMQYAEIGDPDAVVIQPNISVLVIRPLVPVTLCFISFPTADASTDGKIITIAWATSTHYGAPFTGIIVFKGQGGKFVIAPRTFVNAGSLIFPYFTFMYIHALNSWVQIY